MHLCYPIIIAIFGLPGTGKTTFSQKLSEHLGLEHLNTDIIRSDMDKHEQYDEKDKVLIYDEMFDRTKSELREGKSIIVDGTFYKSKLRERFKELAREYDTTVKWIEVYANAETVKERISKRRPYSEADYDIYQKIKTEFEPMETEHLQ